MRIQFNLSYNKNVDINMGIFFSFKLINIFQKSSKLNKIFNKKKTKISYSYTDNIEQKNNQKILNSKKKKKTLTKT